MPYPCPGLPVRHGPQHIPLLDAAAALGAPILPPPPDLHERLLSVVQEPRRLGIVRQRKVRHHAQDDARDALDDQDPPPPAEALHAVHVPDAVGEQAAQRARRRRTDKQVPHAQGELVPRVEEGQVDVEPGEEARLHSAQEQPAREQAAVGRDEAHERRDEPPRHRDEGDPAPRREELEHQVRRHLEHHVRHEEDGYGHLELRRAEAQVLLEPVEASVAKVDSVNTHYERDEIQVQLADQLPLIDTPTRAGQIFHRGPPAERRTVAGTFVPGTLFRQSHLGQLGSLSLRNEAIVHEVCDLWRPAFAQSQPTGTTHTFRVINGLRCKELCVLSRFLEPMN
ncbi:hypothetical protein MHUMG1_02963 [Metarhizium humberi]|uniref:Uncharacterized protein n=1 Tax=Metarhizium humberi TaxID=2596975 RepID=A0A9P8MEP0_9HYPO|nr:hypothetical protein MHUMG1_02963 [Metarhizium humberi]